MKIATWNLNSIRARLERLEKWLEKERPDIVCLQELKGPEENFPFENLSQLGYHAAVLGQKTYNGVAILSLHEPQNVVKGMRDDVEDPQARLVAADIGKVRVISAYFPNGGEVGSDKFVYKLEWMQRLEAYLQKWEDNSKPLLLCGDTNVARDDLDAEFPDKWQDTVLCVPEVRQRWRQLLDWGLVDVFREKNPEGKIYSWWDYRALGFPKNNGLRIDHILATKLLATVCKDARVDRDERKGKGASDHAPVVAEFEIT